MLRKQLSIYFLFRLFTAAAGLAQVLFATAALGVEGYGAFSLLFASASIVKVISTDWLAKATIRFIDDPDHYGKIFSFHLMIQIIFALLSLLLLSLGAIEVLLVVLLIVAESSRLFIMESFRSKGEAMRYGMYTLVISLALATLAIALNFVSAGYKEFTFFWCICIVFISLFFYLPLLKNFSLSVSLCSPYKYLKAGLPLSLSDAVSQFAFSGVRLIIAAWFGNAVLGTYCVIYDIVQRTIVAYMQIVNSSIFPFWRRSWDLGDMKQVKRYQKYNLLLLIIPSLLAVFLLAISSYYIGFFFETTAFENSGVLILSIGLGVIFNRVRTFHFDYFYVLMGKPNYILILACITMIFMLLLILVVNDSSGVVGVSVSVAVGYLVGLMLSIVTFYKLKGKSEISGGAA